MRVCTVTKETGESRDIKVRSLTRREIKELKPLGYNYFGCVPDKDKSEEVVDAGIETVLSGDDMIFLDECPGAETRNLWREMLKETYGDKAEEKNSGNTSDGSPIASE